MAIAERLREEAAPLRAACLAHPFVRGIAAGSLEPSIFARWVRQDWLYLQTYVEVLERAAELAPASSSARWRELHTLTLHQELDLHRGFAKRFGIGATELDRTEPYAATEAYRRFLAEGAAERYAVLVAALLPCGVGYVTLARSLAEEPSPADPRYAEWIATYDDPAFRDAVAWMEHELDRHGAADPAVPATYAAGARHELAFWDALWRGD